MKFMNDAHQLKEQRAQHEQMIQMQKQQEIMKNYAVKETIRQQKMMAEERKRMVSYKKPLTT